MIRIIAHGRLTADPEMKYNQGGTAICKFRVACDWYMKEKQTTFLPCVLFGKRAEAFGKHMARGSSVVIEGNLQIREYEGKWFTECIVSDFEFGSKTQKNEYDQRTESYDKNEDDDIPF